MRSLMPGRDDATQDHEREQIERRLIPHKRTIGGDEEQPEREYEVRHPIACILNRRRPFIACDDLIFHSQSPLA